MNKDKDLWPEGSTYGDLYDPAMMVQTKEEATAYLDKLVRYQAAHGVSSDVATKSIKTNLAYWAAYGDNERRERVERLFECEHPYFGAIKDFGGLKTEEAMQLGLNRARSEGPQTLVELRKWRAEP